MMAASGIDKQEREDRRPLRGEGSCQPGLSRDIDVITVVLPAGEDPNL